MIDPIQFNTGQTGPVQPTGGGPGSPSPSTPPSGEASFADVLRSAIDEVDSLQAKADSLKQSLVVDPNANLQDVMIATEEAKLAFEFTMQVRNKVVQAYEELMRLQI